MTVIGATKGYSETHLILVDVSKYGSGVHISKILESSDILCSDDFGQLDRELRIGTAEVTRRGMEEQEMKRIADFFKRLIIEQENPEQIKEEVNLFASKYSGCRYSL
ncbi:hypothetical protein N752_16920 [Desulforamulus aquiferis]|nr:hypothetical protein N752_16920 [Desulforamulus aquiferis]